MKLKNYYQKWLPKISEEEKNQSQKKNLGQKSICNNKTKKAEYFFISSDNIYLIVKIENVLGEIKYETANAFDNVDQDEVLAYYLDDFI